MARPAHKTCGPSTIEAHFGHLAADAKHRPNHKCKLKSAGRGGRYRISGREIADEPPTTRHRLRRTPMLVPYLGGRLPVSQCSQSSQSEKRHLRQLAVRGMVGCARARVACTCALRTGTGRAARVPVAARARQRRLRSSPLCALTTQVLTARTTKEGGRVSCAGGACARSAHACAARW